MSPSAPSTSLRQILESRLSELSAEMEGLFAEARERGRRESAEQLNQAVRRIRQAAGQDDLGATLADGAAGFATGAAWLRIEGETARGERIRGLTEEQAEAFRGLAIPLASAAALTGAVESRDPVIAAATAPEVSPELMKLAGHEPDARAWIFPVVARERVVGLVYCWGTVQGSAVELLSQAAGGAWKEPEPPPEPEPIAEPEPEKPTAVELVTIAPAPATLVEPVVEPRPEASAPAVAPVVAVEIGPEEQSLHYRAQRFARVRAAEMRLEWAEAILAGRQQRDLYDALREPIVAAREEYRRKFLARRPDMVDYLHSELVRVLANDNPELLGKEYPGPLV